MKDKKNIFRFLVEEIKAMRKNKELYVNLYLNEVNKLVILIKKVNIIIFLIIYIVLIYYNYIIIERILLLFVILLSFVSYLSFREIAFLSFKIIYYYIDYKYGDFKTIEKRLELFSKGRQYDDFLVSYLESYLSLLSKGEKVKFIKRRRMLFIMLWKIMKIILFIYRNSNIIILLLIKIKRRLYIFNRYINYKFYKNERIKKMIEFIIVDCIILFFIRILLLFYKGILRLHKQSLIEIIFFRIEGLIVSICITTNIINYILLYVNYIEIFMIIWIIYIILIQFQKMERIIMKITSFENEKGLKLEERDDFPAMYKDNTLIKERSRYFMEYNFLLILKVRWNLSVYRVFYKNIRDLLLVVNLEKIKDKEKKEIEKKINKYINKLWEKVKLEFEFLNEKEGYYWLFNYKKYFNYIIYKLYWVGEMKREPYFLIFNEFKFKFEKFVGGNMDFWYFLVLKKWLIKIEKGETKYIIAKEDYVIIKKKIEEFEIKVKIFLKRGFFKLWIIEEEVYKDVDEVKIFDDIDYSCQLTVSINREFITNFKNYMKRWEEEDKKRSEEIQGFWEYAKKRRKNEIERDEKWEQLVIYTLEKAKRNDREEKIKKSKKDNINDYKEMIYFMEIEYWNYIFFFHKYYLDWIEISHIILNSIIVEGNLTIEEKEYEIEKIEKEILEWREEWKRIEKQ